MSVAVDANSAVSMITTSPLNFNITLGTGSNGAIAIHIGLTVNTQTITSVTVDGQAAAPVTNADTTTTTANRTLLYAIATGTMTGTKQISITWQATSGFIGATALSVFNANQTTPMNNGNTFVSGVDADGIGTLNINSNAGDLTTSVCFFSGSGTPTTNQTAVNGFTSTAVMDRETTVPGDAGPIAHTWTKNASDDISIAGANFVQAGAAAEQFVKVEIRAAA